MLRGRHWRARYLFWYHSSSPRDQYLCSVAWNSQSRLCEVTVSSENVVEKSNRYTSEYPIMSNYSYDEHEVRVERKSTKDHAVSEKTNRSALRIRVCVTPFLLF